MSPFLTAGAAVLFCALVISVSAALFAQENAPPARPAGTRAAAKRAKADTSLASIDTSRSALDAPIYYDARLIDSDVFSRKSVLTGEAVVKYKDITIEAGKITIDLDAHTLLAEALPETLTVAPDSLAVSDGADSIHVTYTGYPVLVEGGDRIVGETMEYNFNSSKGRVVRGRTDFEGGQYSGQQIKRIAPNVLNVSRGVFTTCDLTPDPHFHFSARKMKIILRERVIARPVVLYIGKVPVALLPFGMFPMQTGRRSGILVPRYGQSLAEGRHLRDFGYYWAINDYMDARLSVDFFEKSGWLFKSNFNYALKYNFTGNVSGSLTRKNFADTGVKQRRWDLRVSHNQTINKTSTFRVSGTFVSDNSFYRDFSFNPEQRLSRTLVSQATYSKRWTKLKSNLSVNLSESKDLDNGNVTRQLPQLRFYFGERRLFARNKPEHKRGLSSRGRRPGASTPQKSRWYENIYFGFNTTAQSQFTRRQLSGQDSLFQEDKRSFVNHDISLRMNSPGKLFGWLGLNQNLTMDEDWFDRQRVYENFSDNRTENTRKGFYARHLFRYRASANTKIYGLFQPKIGSIEAIRHVVTPSISFSYQPDFSNPSWGYYDEVFDADSNLVRLDKFRFQGAGGTPKGKQASLSFSVHNLFQMKTRSGETEKKIDLFSLIVSSGYNFAAKEKKLSSIRTTINAKPTKQINFSMSMSHSPYVFDAEQGREIDRFLWADKGLFGGKYLRLTSLSITSSINLGGKSRGGESEALPPEQIEPFGPGLNRFEDEGSFAPEIPWRTSLTFTYSISSFNPARKTKRAYLNIRNTQISITKNWRVRFSGQIDLRKKQLVGQNWTFYRDMHCWEASLNWTPIGPSRGFYFRINVKASQLRDLRLERRGGRSSIFGGGYYR